MRLSGALALSPEKNSPGKACAFPGEGVRLFFVFLIDHIKPLQQQILIQKDLSLA